MMQPGSTSRRLPGLDVLRGAAILLVMLRHAWPDVFGEAGIVGVAAFFTLSGYLITGIIVRELDSTSRVSYRRFYANRAFRLYPALTAMLVIFAVVELSTDRLDDTHIVGSSVLLGLAYLADINYGIPISRGVTHLWTLAVEEQFYLLWPVTLVWSSRRRRTTALLLAATCVSTASLIGTVLALRDRPALVSQLPTTWAVALLAGAALQLHGVRVGRTLAGTRGTVAAVVFAIGLMGLCFAPEWKLHPLAYLAVGPVVALATVVLITTLARAQSVPQMLRPVVGLGRISYAAYLWNYPIVNWLASPGSKLTPDRALISIALTLAAAVGSWYLVERPVQHLRSRRLHTSTLSTTPPASMPEIGEKHLDQSRV